MKNEIPKYLLKDIATITAGQSPESKYYNTSGDGLPFFQGKADFGPLYPEIKNYCSQPTKIAEKDDILLSVRAPVGPTNLAPCKVCIGRGLTAIRPNSSICLKYLLYFFRYYEAQLQKSGTGTTFKAITQNVVKNIEVPVPDFTEQERIVSKIEELFSRLDASVAEFQTAKGRLKVYRQSVLKEAFLALPKESYLTLDSISDKIFDGPFGSNLKTSDYVESGVRVVRLENLKDGWFDDSKKSFISPEKYAQLSKHTIYPSDLIISTFISNSIKVCQMPKSIGNAINKADCVVIRLKEDVLPQFIMYYLMTKQLYNTLIHQVHGATRPRINTKQIKSMYVPNPKSCDQTGIVNKIQRSLSICDSIEQSIDTSLQRAEALRQSILKQAFEGKL